jgi:hypothetical protein
LSDYLLERSRARERSDSDRFLRLSLIASELLDGVTEETDELLSWPARVDGRPLGSRLTAIETADGWFYVLEIELQLQAGSATVLRGHTPSIRSALRVVRTMKVESELVTLPLNAGPTLEELTTDDRHLEARFRHD